MMQVQFGDLYQQDFSKFKVVSWERYDCGLFVIKFMQGVDYPPGVHLMDDNERPRLLMDLVHDVNNRAKSFVLNQFDEWKGT
ncbi:hypothetical protein Vadar_024985 [Vaccinium darrowii]|uniref:Uncharacterized protein n=1 Tax=Vaccinium darrowii TaxID=229202 RepID=A0ACB7XSX2_9ERIC|nr:hypothetical protein Vadar_024985 [Vaccinium darrowii]